MHVKMLCKPATTDFGHLGSVKNSNPNPDPFTLMSI